MEITFEGSGAPYSMGQMAHFTFTTNGAMQIDLDLSAGNGLEVNLAPFTQVGNEYVWEDQQAGFKYALSLTRNDSVNEVNVFDLNDTFLNQWTPVVASGSNNLDLIKNIFGQYTVATVVRGSHTRGTVNTSLNGAIDFDDGVSFSTDDYALITDRIDVLGQILVDIKPYPTEPYPRLEISVDPNTPPIATGVLYYPNYPNISGRVEVAF